MSRIDKAIEYIIKTSCTPYAAALHIGIDASALYKAIKVRNTQKRCECCGACHVRKAQAFIESHLQEDINLGDIAAATGVCARLLQRAFALHCGCSPMRFVTHTRLQRIRQVLESATRDLKIVDVMMNYGFTHGGKFAQEYQQLFGEKPSETLKRSSQINRQHSPLWQPIDDTQSDRFVGGGFHRQNLHNILLSRYPKNEYFHFL